MGQWATSAICVKARAQGQASAAHIPKSCAPYQKTSHMPGLLKEAAEGTADEGWQQQGTLPWAKAGFTSSRAAMAASARAS